MLIGVFLTKQICRAQEALWWVKPRRKNPSPAERGKISSLHSPECSEQETTRVGGSRFFEWSERDSVPFLSTTLRDSKLWGSMSISSNPQNLKLNGKGDGWEKRWCTCTQQLSIPFYPFFLKKGLSACSMFAYYLISYRWTQNNWDIAQFNYFSLDTGRKGDYKLMMRGTPHTWRGWESRGSYTPHYPPYLDVRWSPLFLSILSIMEEPLYGLLLWWNIEYPCPLLWTYWIG